MKKQLEMKQLFKHCRKCGRELKKPKSILKGMGRKCDKDTQKFLKGLRELAAYENS